MIPLLSLHRWVGVFSAFLLCVLPASVFAQGHIGKVKGHFAAALEFHLTGQIGMNRIGLPASTPNPFRQDAWLDERDDIAMRGFVGEATLQIDWWSLLGEPVSSDRFFWKTSGWYVVRYTDKKSGKVGTSTVSRTVLAKYPDLLKRFDAIAPSNIDFEVDFSLASLSDKDYQAFRKKYNMLETIGAAAPHLNSTFTSPVKGVQMLFFRSDKMPFNAPGSPSWNEFLSLSNEYDKNKLRMIVDYWRYARELRIRSFRVVRMKWPLGEFKAIAEKFDQYERGEGDESFTEKIKAIEEQAAQTPQYASNDFWAETSSLNRYYFYIIDANNVQDDYYNLIVNGINVGPVNNRTGGKTTYYCVLKRGENKVKLALTKLMGKNSRFTVEIDGVFGPREFSGSNDHDFTVNVK